MLRNIKYYFPVHLDGGNRGCEGIAKGTAQILDVPREQLVGLCTDIKLDQRLGIDDYISLYPFRKPKIMDKIMFHVYPRILSSEKLRRHKYSYWYDYFLEEIKPGDMMLITGGDMLCYGDNFVNYVTNKMHSRGVNTILWGCSMGAENLTSEKEETLRKFNVIYTRDSMTQEFFNKIGLDNVSCYCDPAFILQPEAVYLPEAFNKGDVVGINLSNYVLGDYSLNNSFGQHVKMLIDYLLKETDFQILLIPHVTWINQDDRAVVKNIKQMYSSNERINTLNIDNLNYCQIRYVISKCRFFIGARTHAIISAYTTCVPSIALGYSIKSKGIAKDLGLSEQTVVNYKVQNAFSELKRSFIYIYDNETVIKNHLQTILPSYATSCFKMRTVIQNIID